MSDLSRQCPCCGGPAAGIAVAWLRDDGLLVDCKAGPILLTKKEAEVFDLLWRARGRPVTREGLLAALYDHLPGDGPHSRIVDAFICRLRKKLDGATIRIATRYCAGWSLHHRAQPGAQS